MNNYENIPSEIFDWLEKIEFKTLSAMQQSEVLKHFSEEEYLNLQQVATGLKALTQKDSYKVASQNKTELLQRFDTKHQLKNQNPIFIRTLLYWQAAAALLLFLSAWAFYGLFDLKKANGEFQLALKDTVYIEKTIATKADIIHDTVYLPSKLSSNKLNIKPEKTYPKTPPLAQPNNLQTPIYVMPFTSLQSNINSTRGNSMRNDSLLKKYGMVSL